ncbi:hypothetical protein TNCT_713441 [Trichonephila clavata]|uniref:Uncharacterized protein n=1 Tax=Trichonephila clavata TaxID=2740835 RepID=A0A8X6LJY5_TRICU|nr:hypothetical protein TNCT_713441 [Trichonephila clavata]
MNVKWNIAKSHVKCCLNATKSGDFNLKDSESSGIPQSFENEQLQELLDDDPNQIQHQLVKALNVSQETISRRLQAMDKIIEPG